jgi:hypothetical protein
MVRPGVICSFVVVLTCSIFSQTKPNPIPKQFASPDGSRAVVAPVDKIAGFESYESRVDFYSTRGSKLCSADFSSGDGEHGYGVVNAAWTPDGRYFVFSLESSGGHSVMETPTFFYSSPRREFCSLEDYVDGNSIESPDFHLSAPNTVEVTTNLKAKVRVSLDSLLKNSPPPSSSSCFPCTGGRVHKFGDPADHSR